MSIMVKEDDRFWKNSYCLSLTALCTCCCKFTFCLLTYIALGTSTAHFTKQQGTRALLQVLSEEKKLITRGNDGGMRGRETSNVAKNGDRTKLIKNPKYTRKKKIFNCFYCKARSLFSKQELEWFIYEHEFFLIGISDT